MTETTLVLLKPDAVRRSKIGEIIRRIEDRGLRIVRMQMLEPDTTTIDRHYFEHVGRDYYPRMRAFMTSGPLVAIEVGGESAVAAMRQLAGATNPLEAAPGTIRGDLATWTGQNLIHASDSLGSATRELALWFGDNPLRVRRIPEIAHDEPLQKQSSVA